MHSTIIHTDILPFNSLVQVLPSGITKQELFENGVFSFYHILSQRVLNLMTYSTLLMIDTEAIKTWDPPSPPMTMGYIYPYLREFQVKGSYVTHFCGHMCERVLECRAGPTPLES